MQEWPRTVRIAFYAPLKAPGQGFAPSGDRRVAGLLMAALAHSGERVELVSTFRSYDADGDRERQTALRTQGESLGRALAAQWQGQPRGERPDLWFTYHLYYKAPDWLGPIVAASLGIPYVIAEASYAPKRAGGPWVLGHESSAAAIRQAALLVCPTRDDIAGLRELVPQERILHLPPFLDLESYRSAGATREENRARLAAEHKLDAGVPWIAVVAMMRHGDKLASYRALAATLARVADLPWRLVVVGDGPARAEVRTALESAVPGRTLFLGEVKTRDIAPVYAACDLTVWPAINEAYGMALLEAQAAGLPVVSCAMRGVPDVVVDGETGILVKDSDFEALARELRGLLLDHGRRRGLGRGAAAFVLRERSLEMAAGRLSRALAGLV
jgi:glycosyltransferase involved in cell wall biosynthesis